MDFEFDAPQYFDFFNADAYEKEYNDTWFDQHTEDNEDLSVKESSTTTCPKKPRRSHQPSTATNKPQRIPVKSSAALHDENNAEIKDADILSGDSSRTPLVDVQIQQNNERKESSSPKKKPRLSNEKLFKQENVDTSPAANTRSKTRSSAEGSSNPVEVCPGRGCQQQFPDLLNCLSNFQSPTETMSTAQKSPRKSPKKTVRSPKKVMRSPYKAPKESPRRRNLSASNSLAKHSSLGNLVKSGTSIKRSASNASEKKTPTLKRVGSASNLKGKTTEEMELEKIQNLKKEADKTRKQAQDSYKKAMKSGGYMRVRSNTPATLPEGFHFQTDCRLKNANGQDKDLKVKEFTKSLRDALPQQQATKSQSHGLTKTQPFKLSTSKSAVQVQKYQSAAEKIAAFHKQTPDRFRTRPRGGRSASNIMDGAKRDPSPGHLTVPKTPTFATRERSRPVHALTREEKEKMEFEEHQRQQFKAHPVNQKILEKGSTLSKVQAKPATVPEEFNLHHKRAMGDDELQMRPKEEEEKYEFHAKPVNPKILKGPVGVKPISQQPTTVPQSPAFALKNRVRIPVEVPQVEQPKNVSKSNSVPYPGVPFRPRLEHHYTVPEPFSVEERSKRMLTRREQKIQQIIDEEKKAREFHAQDYKEKADVVLPPKQERPPTCPEPFQLSADQRGQFYKEEFFTKQVEEERRQAKKASEFKARPNHVTHKDPFQPQKSNKPLTEINDFALNTDVRANQRDAFEKHVKEKEAEMASLRREREERKEREEKEEVAKMRQEAVHKSQGIKKYKSVTVKPSDKPLTNAHSPCFSQRTRRPNNSDL